MSTVVTAMMTIIVAVIAVMAILRPVRMTIQIRTTMDVIHPARPIVDGTGDNINWWINHHWTSGMHIYRRRDNQLGR